MEEANEKIDKTLSDYKTRKSLAVASFILGIIPLIFIIFEKLNLINSSILLLVGIFSPIFAVIYGIIALTEKENKLLSLTSIILGILTFLFIFNEDISYSNHGGYSKIAHFKSTASSMVPAAILCCDSAGNPTIQTRLSADACNPTIGAIWPTASDVGTITIVTNCQKDGSFSIIITPGSKDSGVCKNAICTPEGCTFTDC